MSHVHNSGTPGNTKIEKNLCSIVLNIGVLCVCVCVCVCVWGQNPEMQFKISMEITII